MSWGRDFRDSSKLSYLHLPDGRTFEVYDDQLDGLGGADVPTLPEPTFYQRVLWQVCQEGKSTTTELAAELWMGPGDIVNEATVSWALEELNLEGLVTYRLSSSAAGQFVQGPTQFVEIRATRKGYTKAGYPPPVQLIGALTRSHRDDAPRHPGDFTDFRNLYDITIGGPIERCSLEEHLQRYPEHRTIHPTKEDLMPLDTHVRLNSLDADTQRAIAAMTVEQVMESQHIDMRTAYQLRKEATATVHAEGADTSLSQRILSVLKTSSMKDVDELRQALFFKHEDINATPMDITKAIWSLQKRNMVTFYERKHGSDSLLTRIKLTRNAMSELGVVATPEMVRPSKVQPSRELKRPSPVGKDMTHPERHASVAKGGPVESENKPERKDPETIPSLVPYGTRPTPPRYAAPAPAPSNVKPSSMNGSARVDITAETYPILASLLAKEQKLEDYALAAAAIEKYDEAAATALLDKVRLTELEKEVLRYLKAVGM